MFDLNLLLDPWKSRILCGSKQDYCSRSGTIENCCSMTFGGDYNTVVGFTFFSSLVHKNLSNVECTQCSCNVLLIYIKV
jgi:hypothetical protein